MTTVYFVRHAKPNYNNHDDLTRELSPKGRRDRKRVTAFLSGKNVTAVYSSPFKRAYDTVSDFAEQAGLPIETDSDFRERRVDTEWIPDFIAFSKKQWADYSYKLSDGECLKEVQDRNLRALFKVLRAHPCETVAIGSHGTALCTVIRAYDPTFGYREYRALRDVMPFIAKLTFNENGQHVETEIITDF